MSSPPSPKYHTFILRLWREAPQAPWRIMLQTANNQRRGFTNLEGLFTFLSGLLKNGEVGENNLTLSTENDE